MSDNAELHAKLLGFLGTEFGKKEGRQCIGVDLLYSPGGHYRDDEIRSWDRADKTELFENFANLETLVVEIIEVAEGETDNKPPQQGGHRFVVRTRQHHNGRASLSFTLKPHFHGGDEVALAPGGMGPKGDAVAAAQILAGNNGQLMRINAQMFDSALRPLAQQNTQLLTELIALRQENSELQKKVAEASSSQLEREFQIAMAADKNARTNEGFKKLLQMGTVVMAKIGGGDQPQGGPASPLAMLIKEFYDSLRPDQIGTVMGVLDMPQKMMFMEIVNMVAPQEKPGENKPSAGLSSGSNGAPTP